MARGHAIAAPRRVAVAASLAALVACAGSKPTALGIRYDRLAPCPTSPSCVSSDSLDPSHRVAPFELRVAPADAWKAAREAVSALPHTRIVDADDTYLHAETTRAFGSIDDLELHLRPDRSLIAVRSGRRGSYTDFGANRRTVEALRAQLERERVLRP